MKPKFPMVRFVQRQYDTVWWENSIGYTVGDSGCWRFSSQESAALFAEYASKMDDKEPVSLSDADLKRNSIPLPIKKVA